jgi:hypothetical protein
MPSVQQPSVAFEEMAGSQMLTFFLLLAEPERILALTASVVST